MSESFTAIIDFLSHPIWQTVGLIITIFGLDRFIKSPKLGNTKSLGRAILRWGSLLFPAYVIYYVTILMFSWNISDRWVLLRVTVAVATLLAALWGAYWGKTLNKRFSVYHVEAENSGSDAGATS